MSNDYREKLFKDIESEIALCLSAEDCAKVSDIVLSKLSEYEVTARCTEVTVRPTINDNILNTYRGCLKVDGKSEKTIEAYMLTLSKFAEFCHKSLLEVNTYDIRLYLAKKLKTGNSARTIDTQRATISAFYTWLFDNGHIDKNPCTPIKPTKYKKEIKFGFDGEEILHLRDACENTRDRMIFEFLLSTGVRVSEFTAIVVDDIDFKNKSVHIRNGKGNKERIIYFNDLTSAILKMYFEEYNILDGEIARGKRGTLTKNGVENILNKLGRLSGVDNVHPHRFRRTFATELCKKGCPVQEIQKLLGHSSMNTTMQYISLCDESTKEAYEMYAS